MFRYFGIPLAALACSSNNAVLGSSVQDGGTDGPATGGALANGGTSATAGTGVGGSAGTAGGNGGSAQCGWQSGLDPGCTAKRAYVECTYPSGASCMGLSDDSTANTECGPNDPGCPSCVVDGGPSCQNQCTPAEYGVACGSPGAPFAGEPVGCRVSQVTPGGVVFFCCPCL